MLNGGRNRFLFQGPGDSGRFPGAAPGGSAGGGLGIGWRLGGGLARGPAQGRRAPAAPGNHRGLKQKRFLLGGAPSAPPRRPRAGRAAAAPARMRWRAASAHMSWEKFTSVTARFFPSIRILHPLPCHRFDARTRGTSPVR
jgi:hypothetical protein